MMSHSNSNGNDTSDTFTSASDITINLDSTYEDDSIVILDNNSLLDDTLLAGGDNNSNPILSNTPKNKDSSMDFIRNEAISSTPAPMGSSTTPKGFMKRKRDESPEYVNIIEEQDSGEGSDEVTHDPLESMETVERVEIKPTANFDKFTGLELPSTVTLLTTPEGSRVYLIGTAHFSKESQDDVSLIIRTVNPHIVCIELCRARRNILQLDEKTILEEANNINLDSIRAAIRQNGMVNGLMYILLLNMSAHLTRTLGMAPGGEFRRAVAEVRQLNTNCLIHMSDRPIDVTIKRALYSLSWWQTLKLTWHLIMSKEPISKEDVERCKQRDLLEEMLKEMAGEFPELESVFVKERDTYLTYSLQLAALPDPNKPSDEVTRVVAVVGCGHVPGIMQHWGKVTYDDITPLMIIPQPSRSSKAVKYTVIASFVGLGLWVGYRFMPRVVR